MKLKHLAVLIGLLPQLASTAVLDVPLVSQQVFLDSKAQNASQWCWNASSSMVLRFLVPSFNSSQQQIADYAVGGYNIPNILAGTSTGVVQKGSPGNSVAKDTVVNIFGVDKVLEHFGELKSTYYSRALTTEELEDEIEGERPVVIALSWYRSFLFFFNKRAGGHAVVIRGYTGSIVTINDPWPGNDTFSIPYDELEAGDAGTYRPGSSPHQWDQSLTVSGSLDLVFLVDSTGSMGDDIANVKANVNTIIDNVAEKFKDYRIAVVDYKDYPQSPWGDSSDYLYDVKTSFSKGNSTAAKNGINALSASGGNDWPESVYSALSAVVDGTTLGDGGWRQKPTDCRVIILGDAPGHDPEPFPGGTDSATVLKRAANEERPIHVHTLLVGGDIDAKATFDLISGGTAGSAWSAGTASQVGTALNSIVDEISENPRFPRGEVASFRPSFAFSPPGNGMLNPPLYITLDLMRYSSTRDTWKPYKRARIGADSTSYTSSTPLPLGVYRWRLTGMQPKTQLLLPNSVAVSIKGGARSETEWTEFERTLSLPGNVSSRFPNASHTASTRTVNYTWEAAPNTSKYAIRIYRGGRLWKSLVVAEPRTSTSSARQVKVTGHKVGASYTWQIQTLNFDRPKPVASDW